MSMDKHASIFLFPLRTRPYSACSPCLHRKMRMSRGGSAVDPELRGEGQLA